MPRIILFFAIIGLLAGCAMTVLPTDKERSSILSGKQTILLLRIICELEDGTSVEAFASSLIMDNVNIGLGGFLIGGKVKRVLPRFLSSETRKQGWIYLILEPGVHYFAFQGPQTSDSFSWEKELRYAPRFQVNIPKNNTLVYIGSLHLYCHSRGSLFGAKRCDFFDKSRMLVENEERLSEKVTTEYLSSFGPIQTLIMRRNF